MTRWIATALVVGALGVAVAGCGDTRSNKDLNGVATAPFGGPAHGAWNPGYPGYSTYSYGGGSDVTTTTRTYPPPYYSAPAPYEPPPYPPPAYPPPGAYR